MFNTYPNTNFHDLNLDFIIAEIKKINANITDFIAANKITWRGLWSINESYPAWSIVDYEGNGYVSIKPVANGIDINNTSYWTKVMSYDAMYAEFEQRFENIENDINSISNVVDTAKDAFNHKNVLCIGDSYLAYSSQEMESESWGAFLRIYLGIDHNVKLNGLGGSGFVGNANKTFEDLLSDAASTYSDTERNELNDIIVCGGLNDASAIADGRTTGTAVSNAIRSFITTANTLFPNAKIHIGAIGFMTTGFVNRDNYIFNFKYIVQLYRKAAFFSASGTVSYLNGLEYVMADLPANRYKPDLIHPTTQASSELGLNIYNALITGSCQGIIDFNPLTITPSGIGSAYTSNDLKVISNNDTITICGGSIGLNINTTSLAALVDNEIGTILNAPVRATNTHPICINVNVAVFPSSTSGAYDIINGILTIKDGKVYIKILPDARITYSNITSISIFVPSYTGNTLDVA